MRDWFRRTFKTLGPGFITGAADDDPAGIATYTQAGASLGYHALWTALFSIPFMIVVQETCARIGIVTGRGLGANMRRRFSYPLVLFLVGLLFAANTLNLGADLGMMAAATQLVIPLSFPLLVVAMALITLVLQIFTTYHTYAKYLKWLTLSLFAYILVAFVVDNIEWRTALWSTIVPSSFFQKDTLMILIAVLGTTISPYLFFWQASEEIEEEWGDGHMPTKMTPSIRARISRRLTAMRGDVWTGMIFSNIVAWFIMLIGAAELHGAVILSADQAAQALAPLAGRFALFIFALGVLGTGLLTVPVLSASAAYAICELLEIPEGLSKKWYQARVFYGLIVISTLLGLMGNFLGVNPVRALIYSSIANALAAPLFLVAIVWLAHDKKTMGAHVSSSFMHIGGWCTVALMTGAPMLWVFATWQGW